MDGQTVVTGSTYYITDASGTVYSCGYCVLCDTDTDKDGYETINIGESYYLSGSTYVMNNLDLTASVSSNAFTMQSASKIVGGMQFTIQ